MVTDGGSASGVGGWAHRAYRVLLVLTALLAAALTGYAARHAEVTIRWVPSHEPAARNPPHGTHPAPDAP